MTDRARLAGSVTLTALIALGLPGLVAAQSGYVTEVAVPGSPFKGLHGLAFDSEDVLHGASITGMSLYRINTQTGAVVTIVGPPLGVADDLAFGPDGVIAWTARDAIHVRDSDGSIRVIAEDVDGANSINFGPDGRLFFTRIFRADELYEGFLDGRRPRLIVDGLKGLNGFEVTDNGKIIGPQFFGNAIVSVNIETGAIETLADGIQTPAAVNLLSNGDVIALGYRTGKVFRIDAKTHAVNEIAQLQGTPIDNLAIDSNDRVFISHSSYNGITELDPDTGETRRVIWGELSAPAGLTVIQQEGHELILSADAWSHRTVDPATGDVTVLAVGPGVFGSAAIAADTDRIVITNTTPSGMMQILDRATGTNIDSLFGFGAPYGVLVEKGGNILVADYGTDSLIRIEKGEGRPRTVIANDLGGPIGIVSDGADGVYVTGHTDGTVSWVDLNSGARNIITAGLARPEGIARLPSGTLAVAEVGTRRLVLVDPDNGTVTGIASDLPIGFDLGGAGSPPAIVTGVAVTRDGSIYVTGDVNNSLIKVHSN